MIEIADPGAVLRWSREMRCEGRSLGFVPTMGFLHEGHLRLVDRARHEAAAVALSIFVNPIQFGPQEDLATYPRDLDRDRRAAQLRGVDCLFVPAVESMYPGTPMVRVEPGPLEAQLCGPRRPGHFRGVLTVVAKLFNIVEPEVAVFGRKDFQQARAIARMVEDLNFPVRVIIAPTVREPDGVALSSRNSYLTAAERAAATSLSRGLEAAHEAFCSGTEDPEVLVGVVRDVVGRASLLNLEYVQIVDPDSVQPVEVARADCIVALAARAGSARLIDNVVLGDGLSGDERLEA